METIFENWRVKSALSHLCAALVVTFFISTPTLAEDKVFSGTSWKLSVDFPDGAGPFPAVIMIPGCSGLGPQAVRAGLANHANALLARGYAAGTLDVLGPRGRVSICADLRALQRFEQAAASDAIAAAKALGSDKRIASGQIAFLGQSFGGSVAMRLASRSLPPRGSRVFQAVIAYYPWCNERYGRAPGGSDFNIPALILAGEADDWTPASRCTVLKPAPGTLKATVRTYPGAVHSFDLPGLRRQRIKGVSGRHLVASSPSATRASRQSFLTFLRDVFKK